jgi:hypothetical protein
MRFAVVWFAFVLIPGALAAQSDARIRATDRADFLAKAIAAAAAYANEEAALLDGFTPIGPELPAMGRHWLNPEFANMGYVDPAKPAFLLFVTINGKTQLGGLGYTLPLQKGEQLPALPEAHAWHEHTGSIEDEAFALASHSAPDDASRFRVVALHIWHAIPSPQGLFSAENWNLPFLRNGLQAPTQFERAPARMLALTNGGHVHYAELVRRNTGIDDATAAGVRKIMASYAKQAEQWAAEARTSRSARTDQLSAVYERMWSELIERLPRAQRAKLTGLKDLLE